MKEYKELQQILEESNKQLLDMQKDFSEVEAETYFNNFRQYFKAFADKFNIADTKPERGKLIMEMCDSNALYAVENMRNIKLPDDLREIAFDYDHDEFPGYEQRSNNILEKKYLVLGGKGTDI